ncbi:MAG: hypothetical protein QUS11_00885 [Candidatus Fermentibacter sp.]|nr:hypothetical protein [Candidatus Fermentibacter sp.]
MVVETNRCPNCGSSLQTVSGTGRITCGYCGTELTIREDEPGGSGPNLITSENLERVRTMIAGGEYIEAIKLYRESTGASLKEAKDAVDAMAKGAGMEVSQPKLWPCPVLIALFAAWIALVGFSPAMAEWLLKTVSGGRASGAAIDSVRVAFPIAIVFISVGLFIFWLAKKPRTSKPASKT